MESVIAFPGRVSTKTHRVWSDVATREFYRGRLEVDPEVDICLDLSKAMAVPISVMHARSKGPFAYRRSLADVRKDKMDVKVIVIVLKGSAKVISSSHTRIIGEGQAGIIHTDVPFYTNSECNDCSEHESYRIVVPSHIFLGRMADAEHFTGCIDLTDSNGQLLLQMLKTLTSISGEIGRNVMEPLSETILATLRECITSQSINLPKRIGVSEYRITLIRDYIARNFTDPDICYEKVAAECGVSRRYICYLLQDRGLSFAEMLWSARLEQAHDWLVAPIMKERPIYAIANKAGFKSAAHFTRMFRTAYGLTPREYRKRADDDKDLDRRKLQSGGADYMSAA